MIPTLLADTVATVVVEDRSELRTRMMQGSDPGFDLTTTPSGRLEVHDRRATFSMSYAPMLTLRDMQQRGFASPEALQNGTLAIGWRDRSVRVALMQSGTYGDQNFTYLVQPLALPGQAAPPPQLLPGQAGSLRFGASHTLLTALARAGRDSWVGVTSSLYYGGGTDELAKELIPLQLSPREELSFDYKLSRKDHLVTYAGAQTSNFFTRVCDLTTGGPRAPLPRTDGKYAPYRSNWIGWCRSEAQQIDWQETWRHKVGRRTDLAVSVGGAAVRSYIEGEGVTIFAIAPVRTRVFPTAALEITHKLALARPDASTFEGSARIAPVIDTRLGIVDPRLMVSVRNITRTWKKATIRTEVGLAQTVPFDEPRAITLVTWSGELTWRLGRRFDVGGGVRGAWQHQSNIGGAGFFTAIGSVFLTYHEPTVRLWP